MVKIIKEVNKPQECSMCSAEYEAPEGIDVCIKCTEKLWNDLLNIDKENSKLD